MRLACAVLFLALPISASAQWSPSLSKAEADGKAKRRPVLILVWTKGDAASDRLEKEIWSVEPVKTVLRSFTGVKVEKSALAEAKTWVAAPRWKAQGEGEAAVPEIRILHPWGTELARFPLKDATAADLGAKLKAEIDTWEERQAPIRLDARALELSLRGQEKDPIHEAVKKVIAHREPWTIPIVATALYQSSVKIRATVIPELRRIEPEDGLWALLKWLDDEATQAGCNIGWEEVARANDIRTLPQIKDGILNNSVCAVIRVKAIGEFKDKSSIPFLIDLFPRVGLPKAEPGKPEPRSLHDDIAASLQKLTGQSFGKDHTRWKEWWKSAGPQFEFPK